MPSETDLTRFFKLLADPTRLKIVGWLAQGERSSRELAALLGVRPAALSHHLARLRDSGLVSAHGGRGDQRYQFCEDTLRAWRQQLLREERRHALSEETGGEEWERRVLRTFLDQDAQLLSIPAQQKKRLVILRWLADQFRPGDQYPEAQVNQVLGRHHADVASLRRALVDEELLQRRSGIYWRAGTVPQPPA